MLDNIKHDFDSIKQFFDNNWPDINNLVKCKMSDNIRQNFDNTIQGLDNI